MSPSASEVASKVASSQTVHSTLSKIFGKKSSKGSTSKKFSVKILKPISIMLLPPGTKTIPRGKNKDKLRDSGNLLSCTISPDDTKEIVTEKVVSLFPCLKVGGFKIMRSTKSGDIFEADLFDANGDNILEFVGNGPLLLSSRTAVVAPMASQQSDIIESKKLGMCDVL